MNIGILSQWFDPEPGGGAISGSLARHLAQRGHSIKVLTGFPNYPQGRLFPGYSMKLFQDSGGSGVSVRRVCLYPSHDNSKARRLANYGSFAVSASVLGTSWLRDLDAIWVYNSPATVALPAWLSKILCRVPHVLHVMDLWPDSIAMSGFGGGFVKSRPGSRLMSRWCDAMYRSAASIAYVSPGIGRELMERGVPDSKLHYAPVWADESVTTSTDSLSREDLGVSGDDLLVLYAGALGESQRVDTFLRSLAEVQDECRVTCLIAGTGTMSQSLELLAEDLGLANVRFLGQVSRSRIGSIARAADLHVVTLVDSPIAAITMPSKIQTTLALAKPFIAVLTGDARAAAAQSGAAFLANPGDVWSIANALREAYFTERATLNEMGMRGVEYYRKTFSAELGVGRIESLLVSAARENG